MQVLATEQAELGSLWVLLHEAGLQKISAFKLMP